MKTRLLLALSLCLAPAVLYLGRWSPEPVGVDAVSAGTPGNVAVVGVVAADDEALEAPAPLDALLTPDQIADLVSKTVHYSGGLHRALDPHAEWILVKPGLVAGLESSEAGRRAIDSHALVVHGVLRLVHSAAAEARISVVIGLPGNEELDIRLAEVIGSPALATARVDLLDLRDEEHEEMDVPDGGESAEAYRVPIALLECDALINVARVTGPGLANAMANLWGFARPGSDAAPLPAQPGAGLLVDLTLMSEVDFTVLDLLHVGTATGLERLNLMAAGADILSVDRVALALPGTGSGGLNALLLASARGLGQVNIGNIKVNGVQVEGTWVEQEDEAGEG